MPQTLSVRAYEAGLGGDHALVGLGPEDAAEQCITLPARRREAFATDDPNLLSLRLEVQDDAVGSVAEGRWCASIFLAQAATGDSGLSAPQLYQAAACYAAEHDLMWHVWGLVGGIGRSPEKARQVADPDVRRRIIPLIRQARDLDEEAANHIAAAMRRA